MIKFQLACNCGHDFEAWFASGAAYDAQSSHKRIICPLCGGADVTKGPMAPAIVASKHSVRPAATPDGDGIAALRALKAKLIESSENVGGRFAEEARNMHFGDSEPRPIHGEASVKEARQLHDDGIRFGILPQLPEDQN